MFQNTFGQKFPATKMGTIELRTEVNGELHCIQVDNLFYSKEFPQTLLSAKRLQKLGYKGYGNRETIFIED